MKSNYFSQFWQGGNHFFQYIFLNSLWNYQIWLFLHWSNAHNIHVNLKAKQIAIIFWEKCCIIWKKCRSANIFGHDCILMNKEGLPRAMFSSFRQCLDAWYISSVEKDNQHSLPVQKDYLCHQSNHFICTLGLMFWCIIYVSPHDPVFSLFPMPNNPFQVNDHNS